MGTASRRRCLFNDTIAVAIRALDIIRRFEQEQEREKSEICEKSPTATRIYTAGPNPPDNLIRLYRFFRTFSELERRCPDHVEVADWQQALEDGRAFLARWGRQAERLGWTPREVFGLAPITDKPSLNYRRLARVDHLGLIWILRAGRPVVALTSASAAIRSSTDGTLTYRRRLASTAPADL